MAIKPTTDIRWATSSIVDPVSGQNNKIEPSGLYKNNGWIFQDEPPFNWENYLKNGYYQWQQYFEDTTDDLLLNNITIAGNKTYSGTSQFTGGIIGNLNIDFGTFFLNATTNRVGINTITPSVLFHIFNSDAGSEPSWVQANDTLLLESNTDTTLQILSPNANIPIIGFSTPTIRNKQYIYANHTDNTVCIGTNTTPTLCFSKNIIRFYSGDGNIILNTTDGNDNAILRMTAGGAAGWSYGATLVLNGNEAAVTPGKLSLQAGNILNVNADITFSTGGTKRGAVLNDGSFVIDDGVLYADAVNNRVGINTETPQKPLDVRGTFCVGATNYTDATLKEFIYGAHHYTNTEKTITGMYIRGENTNNIINIGGGNSTGNAATYINFYTAANNTTITGTTKMTISDTNISSTVFAKIQSTEITSSTISINKNGTGDRVGRLDLITDDTHTSIGSIRLTRVGANGITYFLHRGTGDFLIKGNNACALLLGTNDLERFRITSDGKITSGAENTPDCSPGGLALQQNAFDGRIITLKSTDVSHTATSEVDIDTYCAFSKVDPLHGGLKVDAFCDSAENPLLMRATSLLSDFTVTNTTVGKIHLMGSTTTLGTFGFVPAGAAVLTIASYTTTRFIFQEDGTAHADVTWTTFSDRRKKKNITDLKYGLKEILKLKPKKFTKNEKKMVGLVAQDVKKVMPELVIGKEDENNYLSLDYMHLTAPIIKAIQELNNKFDKYINKEHI